MYVDNYGTQTSTNLEAVVYDFFEPWFFWLTTDQKQEIECKKTFI